MYGGGGSNAWNTLLMDNDKKVVTQGFTPRDNVDLTKDDYETANSTDTISQLTQDLVFLRKDFNKSIKDTNEKRDGENAAFLARILSL